MRLIEQFWATTVYEIIRSRHRTVYRLPALAVEISLLFLLLIVPSEVSAQLAATSSNTFVNFETAPVHPVALSPNGQQLAVCNLADGKLELLDVRSANPVVLGVVPVGIDPVSVRYRNNDEAWVINAISDTISIVNLQTLNVMATIETLPGPADVVFAGPNSRAFVSCAQANTVQVFDPATRQLITNIVINAERPKALAVSPDGQNVYAAIFESGNKTTIVGAKFRNLLFFSNAVSVASSPYGGQNPPPNSGALFNPPINPAISTNVTVPPTGIIVRKNSLGRWMDDNQRDWTEFVSGTNAYLTQRVTGWDLPDRDLAVIRADTFGVTYATGLMNICMAVDVNPVSGRVAVVGTDAINEVRFEPNLNGIFVRVKFATVDPADGHKEINDLNPHLDYTSSSVTTTQRNQSIGDPRAILWTSNGTRAYIAGMGSRNIAVIDSLGNRVGLPLEVGEGPAGLALDEQRQRLYVFNRFSSSISVVDTGNDSVLTSLSLFDPTPLPVAAGRLHLFDTRRTSGLGQASCASCHIDARMDRLGWDLGNPSGTSLRATVNHQGTLVTNDFHPMKGVMVTQTLQDIIGHEPFHWRGDRPDIQSFNGTFTNLQGAAAGLTPYEMTELKDFLSSIRFRPNRLRQLDNSLSTNVLLPGHVALGEDVLPPGTPLVSGNALKGFDTFRQPGNFCATCHTLPTGLGLDALLQNGPIQPGINGEHHFPLAFRLEGTLRSKIAQFRNLSEKIGMDATITESRAGFGFGHDGSIDSLTRFLNGVRVVSDTDVADLIALLLSAPGSDTGASSNTPDSTPPAAVGRQLTLSSSNESAMLNALVAVARSPTGRVDLIAKGLKNGLARGWMFDRTKDLFQSDRQNETATLEQLLASAAPGSEITFTAVSAGVGWRLGIDRDADGILDRDELDIGTNPADRQLQPRILASALEVPIGSELSLDAQIPPLPAAGTISWWKDGLIVTGESTRNFTRTNASSAMAGSYSVVVTTPSETLTSAPLRISIVPLLVQATPISQSIRRGSNALFTANPTGTGPFLFQWQLHGTNLPNATSGSLSLSNVQLANEGSYSVVAANSYGSATSASVSLTVLINPSLVIPPLNQLAVENGNATFSFMVAGHPAPFGFFLHKSSTTVTGYVSDNAIGFLSLFNVQASNAGTYRIVITNAANPSPGLALDPVTLSILTDSDHDGLPDIWEASHGLATNNPADAQLDFDLDGQSNLQEFLAGTDPQDRMSVLKMTASLLWPDPSAVLLQFLAISNQTYSIQARDPAVIPWRTITNVIALPTNRVFSITIPTSESSAEYFRLASPRIP
jgi:YVTN family beta-propeller protein